MSLRPASTGRLVAGAAALLAAFHSPAAGQDLAAMEERTTVHRLANGWTFLIVERPKAPVFSFVTVAAASLSKERSAFSDARSHLQQTVVLCVNGVWSRTSQEMT
jgi:hypothetical protein